MKKMLMLVLLLGLGAKAQTLPPTNTVTLAWNYQAVPVPTNLNFVISESTNLSTNWTVLTNAPSTNCSPVITSNSAGFSLTLPIVPGAYFFVCQSSNVWGISSNSNVLQTPPPAVNPTNFTIQYNVP
jgi:hypothetical protein